jgi:hypothetical protein
MRQVVIALALVACHKSGTLPSDDVQDWSGKKLVADEGTVDGIGFIIQVPQGLPRDKRNKSDWEDESSDYEYAPKIFTSTIEVARVQSLDDAKYHATLDAKNKPWPRADTRPDGWAVTTASPDKSSIEAVTYRQAGDKFVMCKATQHANGPLPSFKKTQQMLESICESLKIVPGK